MTTTAPTLASLRYIRERQLLDVLPFGKTTLWKMVGEGNFPKPIKLSDRITAWKEHEVIAWLQDREAVGISDGISANDSSERQAA